jgi:hypothetical protein
MNNKIKTQTELQNFIDTQIEKFTNTIILRILKELEMEEKYAYIKKECVDGYDKQLVNSINDAIFSLLVNNVNNNK